MRALYYPDLSIQESYTLIGDKLHHMLNVVRVELSEEILLLNGEGLKVKTIVSEFSKRNLILKFVNSELVSKTKYFDIALGMPKKEALELCLKEAVELGANQIYLIKSDYSQMKYLDDERVQSLLISALEQSNAAFLPKAVKSTVIELPSDKYSQIVMMDSQTEKNTMLEPISADSVLLVIGPEGGFSPKEREHLYAAKNVKILKLSTPILRTPTALAAGAGIVWQTLLK
jgi:16S rRNA (uracil1498-N3)-methyltransferase